MFFLSVAKKCYHGQENVWKRTMDMKHLTMDYNDYSKTSKSTKKPILILHIFSPLHLTSYTQQQLKPT